MSSISVSHATKRRRVTSGLTAQQVTHKRELDRKAQRALRDRTKTRIQDLEDDLARLKESRSQAEQAMLEDIQRLREQNRQLKSCLESIGLFATDQLQLVGSQPTRESSAEEAPTEQVQPTTNTEAHVRGPASPRGNADEEPSQDVNNGEIENNDHLAQAPEPHALNSAPADTTIGASTDPHAALSTTSR